jgi:hypothetical protein
VVPLTELDLSIHWRGFAQSIPDAHKALQTPLLGMTPVLRDGESGAFEVVVYNSLRQSELQQIAPLIEAYIRKKGNARARMTVVLGVEDPSEMVDAPAVRLKQMQERSPALQAIQMEFGLSVE